MLANPHRGQVPIKAGESVYTLSLSVNSLCALEALLNRPIVEIILDLEAMAKHPIRLRLDLVRAVLWAAMQDHHPDADIAAAGVALELAGVTEGDEGGDGGVRLLAAGAGPEREGEARQPSGREGLTDPAPLLSAWVEMGQCPSRFWSLTLREISLVLKACGERERRAHNDRAWLAWNIEALHRAKRLPKLADMQMRGRRGPVKPQTMDEQMTIARQWVAASRKS